MQLLNPVDWNFSNMPVKPGHNDVSEKPKGLWVLQEGIKKFLESFYTD